MVLVFVENNGNKVKKAGLEALTYGKKLADTLGIACEALVFNTPENISEIGHHGASKIHLVESDKLHHLDSEVFTKTIAQVFEQLNASILVLSHSSTGKSIAGRLSVRLQAGLVSGAKDIPSLDSGFVVEKSVYSGKALAYINIQTERKIISILGNSIRPQAGFPEAAIQKHEIEVQEPKIKSIKVDTIKGTVPLPEAELVVSAGRGMKGPENWGIVEELANILGATTACSRPVADSDWRPHHEHVGQTGVAIRPNLYIAIGISGAIQHLAGVNNSKTIVVINKDPEAPFFEIADYGIVGDLFEVVPKLNAALQKFKNQ